MIDSHVHLTHEDYAGDLVEVIKEAKNNGVQTMLVIGCDSEEIRRTINLITEDSSLYAALGYHPVEFKNVTQKDLDNLKEELVKERVVALGEIGIDLYWYPDNLKEQEELFEKQLKIAEELNIPVVIHAREALKETYNVLAKHPNVRGVIHSFSGTGEEALRFVELGYLIGLTGPITFKNGHNQKDVAQKVPLDKLLIETDGPYLTPVPFRGKRNMPHYIRYVAEEIANQKNINVDEVLFQTTKNFRKLFLGE